MAAANIVVMTRVANCNMAIMKCLPTCILGNRTVMTKFKVLIIKDLWKEIAWQSVGTITRRVARDAPHREPMVAVNIHSLVLG